MEERIQAILKERFGRDLDNCTKSEIFEALMVITKQEMAGRKRNTGNKKLYYISAEFLIGKLLSNNLINLGMYEEVEKALAAHGRELTEIEEMEMEPSLGNGGLGRLAACFLDSIATLGLPGDGIGLNYHFGLFRQLLVDHKQKEVKNPWITNESWLVRQPVSFAVPYKNFTMHSTLYDIDVPGYNNGCNRLHLFDVDTVDESIVPSDSINFDKHQIQKNLTLFLYPDDSDRAGQLLRIYQQYFMVSNGAQFILMECEQKGYDLHKLYDHVVIQINDTHPSMVIPELIRLLQERVFTMQEAIDVVSKTCAYTNHTILAEALEKWPIDYLEEVVPHLMPIIHELDAQAKKKYKDEKVAIIDKDQRVHMAHMDIHYGYSVNGVAYLHTEILKNSELNNFYKLYPEKFNNKTNGITFGRWLMSCNPELSAMITELIGDGWKKDANELEKLGNYVNDDAVLDRLLAVKAGKKADLKNYLNMKQGFDIDENSIYDIQVKRLHEYKRQQMNALYVIHKYFEIKEGKKPATPITVFFGAKAAPAYVIAKDIIHLILCLQEMEFDERDDDPEKMKWMQTLYHALKELEPVGDYVDARFYTNQALPLSKELIHDLYGDTISGSVTRMEKFAGCAFSHFMQYGLRLRKRLVYEILPTDMGKVFHKTMELVGKRSDWKFADDASRDEFVELMVEQAVTDIQKELFESSHRNEYVLERMKRISKRAVWAMEQHIKRGDFTPEEYEIAFGEENHLDSMTFALEDGEKMFFSGVVDRMDSIEDDENKYLKIIDYKSGKQKFDFAKIFHGLQMQLIIYMNAMMELYEKKTGKRVYPAGMFYFHLDDPIVNVEHENEAEDKILKDLKMSGVVNEDFQLIDHMEHTGSEGYLTLPVRATKNGYDKRSSVLNTTQLFNLGRIVEKKMTELGNSLMHGDISIKPYEYEGRKPCEYCEFKNICAYEDGVDQVEKIKKVSLEEGKHALDETTAESH